MILPHHLCQGPLDRISIRKIPLAPLPPPPCCLQQAPRVHSDQHFDGFVDSTSVPRQELATGRSYGLEQAPVAQVDLRLVCCGSTPLLGGILGSYWGEILGGGYPTTTTSNHHSWGALTKLAMVLVGLPPPAF